MMQHDNQSEVARLLGEINAEYTAARQGLEGLAITARHDFICSRMERAQKAGEEIITVLGTEKALPLIIQAIEGATPS